MWLVESNRLKHFEYAIIPGFISLFLAVGLALGMEFKDRQYGNKFDWLDAAATILGGLLGAIIRWTIILAIWL